MSINFSSKLTKDKARNTITNIRSNQNILLTQLKNFMAPTISLSSQRSRSKNNYSTKNIYSNIDQKGKSLKEKDEIIKKLKEKIKELEKKIQVLEYKINKLSKPNTNFPTSTRNSKNHSISGKENLNEKKEFKSIIVPQKKYSLKTGYAKKRTPSQLLTEENIFDIKEKCNTLINKSKDKNKKSAYGNILLNIKNKSNNTSKNKRKIELTIDKFDKKRPQPINYHNINEILKKSIIKKTHIRKNSKHMNNINELDLKTSISKLISKISKIPKTSRHYQTESNVNLSSKITSSTTLNYYKQNNSNNCSDNNNVLTSNNNIYSDQGDCKDDYVTSNTNTINNNCAVNINTNNNTNSNSNEIVKMKLNQIKMRTAHLLKAFTGVNIPDI